MITIIVCSFDYKKALKSIIKLKKHFPCIIVTPENVKEKVKNVIFLKDEKNGTGEARNIGASKVKTPYIMYMSDDNVITAKQVKDQIEYMLNNNLQWCAFLTRLKNPTNYWNKCLNMRWEKRFYEGSRDRAGMPCIIQTYLVQNIKFFYGFCDDEIFCDRLRTINRRVGYSNIVVYEDNFTYKELKARFEMYGISDRQYYEYNIKNWTFLQKLYYFFRIFIEEWQWDPYYWRFYAMIIWNRYKIRIFGC